MLEADLSGKEDLKIDLQRTKDELRDVKEELAVSNNQISQQEVLIKQLREERDLKQQNIELMSNGGIMELSNGDGRIGSGVASHSSAVLRNGELLHSRPRTTSSSISTTSAVYVPPTQAQLTSSKSLRKIHGMLDQMRSLESRVATFKSSLPRSSTPTSLSPHASGLVKTNNFGGTSPPISNSLGPVSPATSIPVWSSATKSPDSTAAMDTTNAAGSLTPTPSSNSNKSAIYRSREASRSFYGSPVLEQRDSLPAKENGLSLTDENDRTPVTPSKPLYYHAPSVRASSALGTIKGSPSEHNLSGTRSTLGSIKGSPSEYNLGGTTKSTIGFIKGSPSDHNYGNESASGHYDRYYYSSASKPSSRSIGNSDGNHNTQLSRSASRTETRISATAHSDSRLENRPERRTPSPRKRLGMPPPSPSSSRLVATPELKPLANRPGSAFSALRPKTSIGHGRFV